MRTFFFLKIGREQKLKGRKLLGNNAGGAICLCASVFIHAEVPEVTGHSKLCRSEKYAETRKLLRQVVVEQSTS